MNHCGSTVRDGGRQPAHLAAPAFAFGSDSWVGEVCVAKHDVHRVSITAAAPSRRIWSTSGSNSAMRASASAELPRIVADRSRSERRAASLSAQAAKRVADEVARAGLQRLDQRGCVFCERVHVEGVPRLLDRSCPGRDGRS